MLIVNVRSDLEERFENKRWLLGMETKSRIPMGKTTQFHLSTNPNIDYPANHNRKLLRAVESFGGV